MNDYALSYALSKQVPAMRDEVTLHTVYGDLTLYDGEAAQVAALVEQLLRRRWRRMNAAPDIDDRNAVP